MTATRPPQDRVIRDVMSRPVHCLQEDENALRAAELMAEEAVGALPIQDRRGRLRGVVTDRDLVVKVLAQGRDARAEPLGDLVDREPVIAHGEEELEIVLDRMRRHAIRRIPVVDDGQIVGIVSEADIATGAEPARAGALTAALAREPADQPAARWVHEAPYRPGS